MTDPHLPPHAQRRAHRRLAIADLLKYAAWFVFAVMLTVIALQNRSNGERLIDCTTPGHPCYDQAQSRQADVIGSPAGPINTVIVLAIACADEPGVQSEAQIIGCVQAKLDEGNR
jgi:hypothetical protein